MALKKVTSEIGTQVGDQEKKPSSEQVAVVTKSVSVENLTSPTKKPSEGSLLQSSNKAYSESSDPICGSQVKKWSYTNGRTSHILLFDLSIT